MQPLSNLGAVTSIFKDTESEIFALLFTNIICFGCNRTKKNDITDKGGTMSKGDKIRQNPTQLSIEQANAIEHLLAGPERSSCSRCRGRDRQNGI